MGLFSTTTVTILDIVLVFLAAAVAARVFRAAVHRKLVTLDIVSSENRAALHARAARLIRMLTLLAFGAAAFVTLSIALDHLGVSSPLPSTRRIVDWLLTSGVAIVVIIVAATLIIRAAHLAIEHLQHKLGHLQAPSDLEWQRRASTLSGVLSKLVSVVVGFIAILILLRQLSIDIVPILTGAGIAGLAIGFGAQNLVRDVISGFFLILEDQVRVGDAARINGVSGTVEQINLRTIVLRDVEGAVQVFPNGTITALANLSKHYAFAVVDVRVSYREDIERVLQTIKEVGAELQRDPEWRDLLPAPLEISGIESLANGFALVRMRFRTQPLKHGAVANELRRRIMRTFVARKIRPFARYDIPAVGTDVRDPT